MKFNCMHCKTLLSIHSTEVGSIVNCPKCGNLVEVPTITPTPAPSISADTEKLAVCLTDLITETEQGNKTMRDIHLMLAFGLGLFIVVLAIYVADSILQLF